MLFLSYAEEDGDTASEVAERLRERGLEVWRWQAPENRAGQFIEQIEKAIGAADAFLALLSPSFLASPWCRMERDLALHREQDLRAANPAAAFIRVLKIIDGAYRDAGFLRNYDWVDLASPASRLAALQDLLPHLRPDSKASPPGTGPGGLDLTSPLFRNRHDELKKVVRGLTNAAGPHFWLVITPPQLGKTWFLNRVSAEVLVAEPTGWAARSIDLREQPADVRADPGAILARLFGLAAPIAAEPKTLLAIARAISRSGKSHLCLLDSAELLDEATARILRSCLSQIYRLVQRAGKIDVRLALIVASRREDEWRGVTPAPRLYPLPLTEFKVDVVQDTLRDLAKQMGRSFGPDEFEHNAVLVHRLSEGLPALLVRCLQWIRAEEWLAMDRLDSPELFAELAHPYIREELLSPESLVPGRDVQAREPRRALDEAFRVLAPYRLFTQSHLRHHLGSDRAFETILEDLGWSMEDLWKAISATALLLRPLNEPWQEIHSAIRRLLYRYYYTSSTQRAEAHREARKFVEVWADRQAGKEQVIGLVECLWHEAAVLRLSGSAETERALSESARTLSQALKPSSAYTLTELREYAAERMRNDEEFQEVLSDPELFNALVGLVVAPRQES
jgi:hypothetical protein